MIEMTDAPVRIWAEEPEVFDGMGFWQENKSADLVEYLRLDAPPSEFAKVPAVQALVAAAYEAAAQITKPMWSTVTAEPVTLSNLGEAIRAITPAEALAALDRLVEERVQAKRERAAKVGGDKAVEVLLRHDPDAGPLKVQLTRQGIAAAILGEKP